MRHRRLLLALLVVALLVAASITFAVARPAPATDVGAAVKALGMFDGGKWKAFYRAPSDEQILSLLQDKGIPLSDAKARQKAVEAFRQDWAERNPTTPNPKKLQKLLRNEREGHPGLVTANTFQSLIVPMEFNTTPETFTGPTGEVTTAGPLHNEIPAPGKRDNNTIWYDDASASLYEDLYFGQGPDAGVVVHHPNVGTIDFRGNTMANYYLEQSEGKFVPHGAVYPTWLAAAHSEAWYGADNEVGGSNHNVRAADLVREAVDAINADDPDFNWESYDGNGDGVVDNFTVIHAGMGQEAGGGTQGDYSIWSHASAINLPSGYLACAKDSISPGVPSKDIYVREYSMDPENIDVGVISEEYGHAAFGLPDIYTTDYQASPSNWAIMEAGSWNGKLGGMQPAPFPLFFRYLVGWADPVELDYTTAAAINKVGQLSKRPDGTKQGIKINLPDQVVETPNRAGTGKAWWSDRADLADFYLAHDFDLTGRTAPIFSFASYWSFEQDYDYGYFEVSDDGGATWDKLTDMDGTFVSDGNGNVGLNGEGQGTLRFDLSAYAGETITLRLHYTSDVGVQWAGWWADDFQLADGATVLFTDDVEGGANGWTTNHFVFVPKTDTYPMYYLAEWRNNSGFDRGLKYAYQTVYDDPATTEWEVDRNPYTVPGMVLWIRNGAYDFDYTLSDSWFDAPSYGPKHALLVVDSHYWPLTWSNYTSGSGAPLRVSSRSQSSNAAFTLQKTTPFTLRLGYDPATGEYLPQDQPAETKTFRPQAAVSQFHDSLGYYPGLWYKPDVDPNIAGLYFWEAWASATIPAKGDYTTKVTWWDKTPATYLYGTNLEDTILGTGDPRDSGVQYGVNIAVLSKADNGSWGKIAVWNATTLAKVKVTVDRSKASVGQQLKYTLTVKNPGPAAQPFSVIDPIPAGTSFVKGSHYSKALKAIKWSGKVASGQTLTLVFSVKVQKSASGTTVKNVATLHDDANGWQSSASTTVK